MAQIREPQVDPAMLQRIQHMTPEERDQALIQLLASSTGGRDDPSNSKIEDANLLLSMRPWVLIQEINPRTGRISQRRQDRKQWDNGLFDPYVGEDDPNRSQIIKCESVPDGEVLFEREVIMGAPTPGAPVVVGAAPGGNTELMATLSSMQKMMEEQAKTIAELQRAAVDGPETGNIGGKTKVGAKS